MRKFYQRITNAPSHNLDKTLPGQAFELRNDRSTPSHFAGERAAGKSKWVLEPVLPENNAAIG